MDQARFQQLEKIFHEALGIPPAERDGHLRQACGDNRQLLKTIRELLDAAQESQSAAGWRQMSEQDAELPQFGIFQAVRILGRGGTGVVYLARRTDGQFEQLVAVKTIQSYVATP